MCLLDLIEKKILNFTNYKRERRLEFWKTENFENLRILKILEKRKITRKVWNFSNYGREQRLKKVENIRILKGII